MEFKLTNNKHGVDIMFTPSQEKAVSDIIDFIAKDFDEKYFIHALCGAGGVGKTFVTKYIINHSRYASSMFTLTAPTHKACRVLEQATDHRTKTIQSCFGFRLDIDLDKFDPNKPEFKPIGKIKINNETTKVLVVDESSMLNSNLVIYIKNFCLKNRIKLLFIGK